MLRVCPYNKSLINYTHFVCNVFFLRFLRLNIKSRFLINAYDNFIHQFCFNYSFYVKKHCRKLYMCVCKTEGKKYKKPILK